MRLALSILFGLFAAMPAFAQEAIPLTSEAFAADLHAQEGKLIAVGPCDVQPYETAGNYSCVLKTADGSDAKDPGGLPVYVFFEMAALGQPEKDFLASDCTSYCKRMVTITGTASIAEGTDFVLFTGVKFTPL
ncbi:MAG: hypothetical protein ABIO40_12380 [Devosia sp.]